MSAERPPQRFDHLSIRFPTDTISIAQMRQKDPGAFTRDALSQMGGIDALTAYSLEYTLAAKAFARACGARDPYPTAHRDDAVVLLNDAYVRFGLSAGMAQTTELIRRLEDSAALQAANARGLRR